MKNCVYGPISTPMPLQPMAASTPDKSIKQETTVNVEQLGSQLAPISQLI